MTTLREAAQAALNALTSNDCDAHAARYIAIFWLSEALAKPDGCDYDDCINYDENELCYRWSSGDCPGPRNKK
jgi:hypothetical protein